MAAKHAKKIDNEEMPGKDSTDDSDEEDGSDDGSHTEDWERSSSAEVADGDDKLHNEQEPITRTKAGPCTSDAQKTRQVQETDIEPGMQKAVDAVVKKGMGITAAAKQHNLGFDRLKRAVIKTGFQPRVRDASKTQIDAAIKDIVERGVSINRATKLYRVHHTTLKKILNLKEYKPVPRSSGVPNPQIQKAVDAVVKKGMSMRSAAKLYRIDIMKTLKPNIIKAGFQPPQRKDASKTQIDAAVKYVMERHMSIKAASTLHRMDYKTLSKALKDRNLTRPESSHRTKAKLAVRAVANKNQSAKAAAKRYGLDRKSVQNELKRHGYVFEGSSRKGGWVKPASSKPVESSSAAKINSPTDGNQADTEKEWTDAEEDEEEDTEKTSHEEEIEDPEQTDCPPHSSAVSERVLFPKRKSPQECSDNGAVDEHGKNVEGKLRQDAGGQGKGGVNTRDELPDQEIERIVDVRTQRQYLVKWQGEEEATWVDEDIFLGLTNLAIK